MFKKDIVLTDFKNLADGIENRYPVNSANVLEEEIQNGIRFNIHVKLEDKEITFYRDYVETPHQLYEMKDRGWYIKDKEECGQYRTVGDVMKIFSQRVQITFE